MRCLIFCAGGFDSLLEPVHREDIVIAADGGLKITEKLGLMPNLILGDFDSLGYTPEGAEVHPVEKDDTDAMLAVRRGLERSCDEFILYGSLDGPRLDHTVANFQTLQFLADRGATGYLVGIKQMVTVLKNASMEFPPGLTGNISVFAQGGDAEGVTIRGLFYGLEEGRLSCGFPLGVSNHFTEKKAEISVKNGTLLIIWDKGKGLPKRKMG